MTLPTALDACFYIRHCGLVVALIPLSHQLDDGANV